MTVSVPAISDAPVDRAIADRVISDHLISDQLAPRIARALEQEIIAAGWPVGQSLGN